MAVEHVYQLNDIRNKLVYHMQVIERNLDYVHSLATEVDLEELSNDLVRVTVPALRYFQKELEEKHALIKSLLEESEI